MSLIAGTFVGRGTVLAGAEVVDGVGTVMLGLVETLAGVSVAWTWGRPEPQAVSSTAAPAAAAGMSNPLKTL